MKEEGRGKGNVEGEGERGVTWSQGGTHIGRVRLHEVGREGGRDRARGFLR